MKRATARLTMSSLISKQLRLVRRSRRPVVGVKAKVAVVAAGGPLPLPLLTMLLLLRRKRNEDENRRAMYSSTRKSMQIFLSSLLRRPYQQRLRILASKVQNHDRWRSIRKLLLPPPPPPPKLLKHQRQRAYRSRRMTTAMRRRAKKAKSSQATKLSRRRRPPSSSSRGGEIRRELNSRPGLQRFCRRLPP